MAHSPLRELREQWRMKQIPRSAFVTLFVAGIVIMFGGTCAGMTLAEGFGDPPPTVSAGRPFKLFAIACLAVGPVLSVAGAVLLYRRDRNGE